MASSSKYSSNTVQPKTPMSKKKKKGALIGSLAAAAGALTLGLISRKRKNRTY